MFYLKCNLMYTSISNLSTDTHPVTYLYSPPTINLFLPFFLSSFPLSSRYSCVGSADRCVNLGNTKGELPAMYQYFPGDPSTGGWNGAMDYLPVRVNARECVCECACERACECVCECV